MWRPLLCCFCLVAVTLCLNVCSADETLNESAETRHLTRRVDQLEKELVELKNGQTSTNVTPLSCRWDNGLVFENPDAGLKFKIGGRLMFDFGSISQSDDNRAVFGDIDNAAEVRRARLYVSGDIYGDAFFKVQFDFADEDVQLKDCYIGCRKVPVVGHIRVGHQEEPFSLNQLTSSKYVTFIESSLPTDVFAPEHNLGVMLYNTALGKKMTWAIGLFRDTDDTGTGVADDGFSITGRVTGTPWMSESADRLLHLGVAYSYREPPDDTVRFSCRPEWHQAPSFADTTALTNDEVSLIGLEAALVLGPLDVQAEYMHASTDDADFSGWYVQGAFWLTGEHRKYSASEGVFTRVSPNTNFSPAKGGWGAWQVAARYSSVDLTDGPVDGGKVDDVTLGLNWHLNPNMRVMFNCIHSEVDDGGDADIALVRCQVDF